jgi:hypothetical protein
MGFSMDWVRLTGISMVEADLRVCPGHPSRYPLVGADPCVCPGHPSRYPLVGADPCVCPERPPGYPLVGADLCVCPGRTHRCAPTRGGAPCPILTNRNLCHSARCEESFLICLLLCLTLLLAACTDPSPTPGSTPAASLAAAATLKPSPTAPKSTARVRATRTFTSPAHTVTPTHVEDTAVPYPTSPPEPTLTPMSWQELPVIPTVSAAMQELYQRGLENGNNPRAFSKMGDCETVTKSFLGAFDLEAPKWYRLGPYTGLQELITYFKGSFTRTSVASKTGFTSANMLSSFWADASQCQSGETPLDCEYRLHRPSLVVIMLGTNDVKFRREIFEANMRRIIEFWLEKDVVPVLATKADNLEGDGSINAIIARLAGEYDLPLWNFWRALQDLPEQGLQPDRVHLTWAVDLFDDPEAMQKGWPVRNLTALQTLDAVWRGVTGQ